VEGSSKWYRIKDRASRIHIIAIELTDDDDDI
jgi:hypothetical protein